MSFWWAGSSHNDGRHHHNGGRLRSESAEQAKIKASGRKLTIAAWKGRISPHQHATFPRVFLPAGFPAREALALGHMAGWPVGRWLFPQDEPFP
jgi:hypothetical protein